MALASKNNFLGGINLDLDQTRMPPNTAQFIKNLTSNVNMNAAAASLAGSDAYAMTPLEGNVALSISGMPGGDNYCIGYLSAEQTNEGYFCLLNSKGLHTVWVIRGDTGAVQKVHQNSLLPFVLNPKYFLSEGRMTLELRSIIDPVSGEESNFKFLIFTNNNEFQCVIDVEASIATNSYSTSYFTSSSAFYEQLELINLGSALPIKCVKLNNPNPYIPVTATTAINTASVNTAGAGYAVGNTFTVNGGSPLATGLITAVNGSGAVEDFIITFGGVGYAISGVATTATSGAGSGLIIDIRTLQIPDINKPNLIVREGWQFRVRTWDVWGRPSEWGIISSVFTSLIGGGCIAASNGLPRCVNLCFDAGSPLVKFITIAYRRGAGNDPSGQTETGWYETETFRKYNDSAGVEWYQRTINNNFTTAGSGMTFDASTNIITYAFCADKGSNPVDPTEAARTEPGIARWSSGVASINKRLLLDNNVYGFQPIEQTVIDNVIFSALAPSTGAGTVPCPAPPLRTIIVYANLYNAFGDYSPLIRQTFGQWTFGDGGTTLPPSSTSSYTSNFKVGQVFGDQTTPGFIAYLEGTSFKVIGEWGNYDPATGTFTAMPLTPGAVWSFPNIKMTRFTFVDVPAGKYVVRLASHHAKLTDANIQGTSTQVGGVCPIGNALSSGARRTGYFSNPVKEIAVDCSTGNTNLGTAADPMFIILDLNNGVHSGAIDGYLREYSGGGPVEMAICYIHGSTIGALGDAFGSFFTDHNGYFFVTSGSSYTGIDIFADLCDGGGLRQLWSQTDGGHSIVHGDGTGTRSPDFWGNVGNWQNQVYLARPGGPVTIYPTVNGVPTGNRTIKQKILLCASSTIGVPGIPVVMTKCKSALTDSSGVATITAHGRYNYVTTNFGGRGLPYGASYIPNYAVSPGNQDLLIFSQKGGCQWNACGSCDTFMADAIVPYADCCPIPPGMCTRITVLADLHAKPNGVGLYGVQSGGKYPVSFVLHDTIARHTAPQIKSGDLAYVFVPSLNDTIPSPYPAMALCSLQVYIPPGLTVDPVFKHITFAVGSNCAFRDFFDWAADWVQYVDNTGATNITNPTAIRIYFQSLNEYNKQYNFGTNVSWDFIAASKDPTLPSDVVQFIMNGDGTWLAPQKGAPITYDKAGSFFTIDYMPELAGLQNGCLFRIVRSNQNTTGINLPYYEQCLTLDVNNGVLPAGTYIIPYQDSYLLSRQIPVPQLKGQPSAIPPGGTPPNPIQYTSSNQTPALETDGYSTNNVNNNNGVVIFNVIDYPTSFPFFFESPSPSDLWGSHLASKGRVMIPNPYEQQYRVGTEFSLSNPLADRGIVNGMGVYLSSNRKVFDRNAYGDITVVLVEQGVCMAICNNDYFITRYNQTQIQINENGQVIGQNADGSVFTDPQTKVGSNYGVIMANINTIQRYNGQVVFLDNKGHLIFSDFQNSKPVEKDGYLGYLLNKIAVVNIANQDSGANGVTYFSGGIDPKTMEYFLTMFNIPTSGAPSYINTESAPNPRLVNETLIFDLATGILKSFASFTPEYYGRLPGYYLQKQFISFKNGVPYIHHNSLLGAFTPPPYISFYGVQCTPRITHVVNGVDGKQLPDKVKRYLWTEVYCRQSIPGASGVMPSAMWYSDQILSEKGQTSRLLVARWDLKDGYATACFICAINTPVDSNRPIQTGPHAILDGDPLQGKWCQISLTTNPAYAGQYFEVSSICTYINGIEKSAE